MATVENSPKSQEEDIPFTPTTQALLEELLGNTEELDEDRNKYEGMKRVDSTDGNIVSNGFWIHNDVDTDIRGSGKEEPYKVQFVTCNQRSPPREGYFLTMRINKNAETGFTITTTDVQNDPNAMWKAYFSVDDEFRQVIILENQACSEETGKKCVLATMQDDQTGDFLLTGEKISEIPKRLTNVDPTYGFYKGPKSTGSELLFLKSMLGSEKQKLFVGFDSEGQPLPLNKVNKYSRDYQAFFRVIPGEYM